MKKPIIVLLSLAVVFACQKDPDNPGGGETGAKATVVRVSPANISFEALNPESQTVKVYADGSWTAEAPDWVTLDPKEGDGTVTVTITVTDNDSPDGRTGTVVFAPELSSKTNVLTIQQKGDNKVSIKTGQALVEWLAKLDDANLDEARLAADIDMAGITLVSAKSFGGTLDGEGHSIKNLKATGPLFKVNKGIIKNIVIDASCSFEPDTTVFGTIVSRNEGSVIDCVNNADVTRKISNNASEMKSNLVAGIVGMSTKEDETISGCKNFGNISLVVTDNGGFTSQGVAGIIALTAGGVANCENHGEVKLEGGWHTGRACPARTNADGIPDENGPIDSGEIYTTKVSASVGGVVAYVKGDLSKCLNAGNVSWIENYVEKITASPARMFAGGVAGNYFGNVTDCTNEGVFTVKAVSSDGSNVTSANHQIVCGGVLGGVNNPSSDVPSKNRGTNVDNCVNKGKVVLNANTSRSQIHLGGVVGWPNGDNDVCNGKMTNCSNVADIEISGTSLVRAGGVAGCSPHMEGCSSKNKITVNAGAHSDSAIGGLLGAHFSAKQNISNCSVDVVLESAAAVDLAALVGDISGSDSRTTASFEGCTVKGSIKQTGGYVGMLVGWCKGETVKVTMGTSAAPIEIAGSVNGVALTSSSPTTLLWGTGYKETSHSLNYVIK